MNSTLKIAAFFVALFFAGRTHAQQTWSLERCVQYAQENNITIKQAQANVRLSQLSERQAKASRLPNVSASFNVGKQFGRTIDPTTNDFSNTATDYNSLGLSAGVNLFSGGLINHTIKQAGWQMKSAQADAEQLASDLSLQVAAAYLNILLFEEQVENAGRRVTQTGDQLSVTEKLIAAGTVPMADKYNILAQAARDEQLAVTARNSVELAYLSLKQLLQLEPDYDLRIERPEAPIPADANPAALTLTPVYDIATSTQASIRSADFRIKSAEEGVSIARSAYYPSVSLFASLSSNYSSQFFTFVPTGIDDRIAIPFEFQGVSDTIYQINPGYRRANVSYFDQVGQNFGQGIGLNISIPIYQNGRTRLGVERARLGVLTAEMQNTQTRQQLKNDIQTAIANARAASQQLDAAQKTFDATRIAFQNTEKRHTLGSVNALDLTTAKTNLDIAENELVVAKYDYLFKLKILDFYQGKPLVLR